MAADQNTVIKLNKEARSPDLNPLDFSIWSILETRVLAIPHTSLKFLKAKLQRNGKQFHKNRYVPLVINPSGLLYDPNSGHALGHGIPHRVENLNQKPKLIFKMPRVVPDQKNKFENDDLFRRLVRESEVKYTGYRDRPADERRQHFQKSLRSGVLEIAIVSNGTNINLCFSAPGSNNYNNNNNNNNNNSTTKELDLDKEPGKHPSPLLCSIPHPSCAASLLCSTPHPVQQHCPHPVQENMEI
ncbi:Core binding factor beta subunit [Trinorchestia longiramus]|nr:Core binding factor beta subunit [Trinorchestia longiramus]